MEDIGFLEPAHGLAHRSVRLRQHAVHALPQRHLRVHARVRPRRDVDDPRRQWTTRQGVENLNMPPSFVILDRVVWGISATSQAR